MNKTILSGLSAIALLATGAVNAQVTESVEVGVTIQKEAPVVTISGLDSAMTSSYDGDRFSEVLRNNFCIYSSTVNFSFMLEGTNDQGGDFFLSAPGETLLGYHPSLAQASPTGNIEANLTGELTAGEAVSIDGNEFVQDETCTDYENVILALSFYAYGNPNDLNTVYDSIDDGLEHVFTDTLTMTVTPEL